MTRNSSSLDEEAQLGHEMLRLSGLNGNRKAAEHQKPNQGSGYCSHLGYKRRCNPSSAMALGSRSFRKDDHPVSRLFGCSQKNRLPSKVVPAADLRK